MLLKLSSLKRGNKTVSDITNCLHSVNSHVSGNKWDCSCASGLQKALEDMANVHFQGNAHCRTPDIMRNHRIFDPNCGEYRRQKTLEPIVAVHFPVISRSFLKSVFVGSRARQDVFAWSIKSSKSPRTKRSLSIFVTAIYYVHILSTKSPQDTKVIFSPDTNECLKENDCDDEAVCTNIVKGYKCHCATQGFTGNGKECTGN